MNQCPLCGSIMMSIQEPPAPKAMQCLNSYRSNGHVFQYLCYETGEVHHYQYTYLDWTISYWPPNPNYPDSKPHVVIQRHNCNGGKPIYAGSTRKDFVDFPQILEYLKLLNLFS